MHDIQVIDDPATATVAMEPTRSRILSELALPASAATLATRVGLTRQKVNYHLRALEEHGLVRLAQERKWGGLTERERRALLRRRPNVVSWRALLETAREEHDTASGRVDALLSIRAG